MLTHRSSPRSFRRMDRFSIVPNFRDSVNCPNTTADGFPSGSGSKSIIPICFLRVSLVPLIPILVCRQVINLEHKFDHVLQRVSLDQQTVTHQWRDRKILRIQRAPRQCRLLHLHVLGNLRRSLRAGMPPPRTCGMELRRRTPTKIGMTDEQVAFLMTGVPRDVIGREMCGRNILRQSGMSGMLAMLLPAVLAGTRAVLLRQIRRRPRRLPLQE